MDLSPVRIDLVDEFVEERSVEESSRPLLIISKGLASDLSLKKEEAEDHEKVEES